MKKILVGLLSLGLIAAFAASASALDVKFSGQYYVTGVYENNRSLKDTDATNSLASFYTRTRVQTVFTVAPGLTLTTRFDALEKMWGSNVGAAEDKSNSRAATVSALQENLEFEHAYINFKTAAGQFRIGYQAADEWGTGFADTPGSRPRIQYITAVGPLTVAATYEKLVETVNSDVAALTGKVDADSDNYMLSGTYRFKGGEAGVLYKFINGATTRVASNYRAKVHALLPYAKAKIGKVDVEGELVYMWGKTREFENGVGDVKAKGWGFYAKAKLPVGPAYVGGQVGFSSGDDATTPDKDERGPASSTSWSPALIFGEANVRTWIGGSHPGGFSTNKQNFLVYNVFGGMKVTPKMNVEGAFSVMKADWTAAGVAKDLGMELDVTASYKIYDNLTYMVGAGYLWTGDYFKGAGGTGKVGNDYILLNRLTFSF